MRYCSIFYSTIRLLVVILSLGHFSAVAQVLFVASSTELGLVDVVDGTYTSLTVSPNLAERLSYDSMREEVLSLEADNRTITRFDLNGGFIGRVIVESGISFVTVASDGEYYAIVRNRIFKLDRSTGVLTAFVTLQSAARIYSFIASGDELLVTNALGQFIRVNIPNRVVIETKGGAHLTVGHGPDPDVVYVVEGVSIRPDSGAVYRVDISTSPADFEFIGTFEGVYIASTSGDPDILYLGKGDVLNYVEELMALTISSAELEVLPIYTDSQYRVFALGSTSNKGLLTMVREPDVPQEYSLRFYNAPDHILEPDQIDSKSYTSASRLLRLEGDDLLAYTYNIFGAAGSSRLYDARNFSGAFTPLQVRSDQILYENRSEDRILIRDGRNIISTSYDLSQRRFLGRFSQFPGETIWAEQLGVFVAGPVSGDELDFVQLDGTVTASFRLDFSSFAYDFYAVSDNNVLFFSGSERNVGEDLQSKSLTNLQAPQELVFEVDAGEEILDVENGRDSSEIFLVLDTDSGAQVIRIVKDFAAGTYSSTPVVTLSSDLFVRDTRFFKDIFVSGTDEQSSYLAPQFDAWWDGAALQVRRTGSQSAVLQVRDLSGKLLTTSRVENMQHSLTLPSMNVGVVVVSVEIDGEVGTKLVVVAQ